MAMCVQFNAIGTYGNPQNLKPPGPTSPRKTEQLKTQPQPFPVTSTTPAK